MEITTPAFIPSPPTAAQGVLLDFLPEELRQNIAARVGHGSPSRDALALASVSTRQYDAFLDVTHFSLSFIDEDQSFNLVQWLHLVGPSLQHLGLVQGLHLAKSKKLSSSELDALYQVFALGTLRSVEVQDFPDHLNAVVFCPPPKISVVVLGYSTPEQLVQALRAAPMSEFSLEYRCGPFS